MLIIKKHARFAIVLLVASALAIGGVAIALGAGKTTETPISDNLFVVNESAKQIQSVSYHMDNQSVSCSNADNSFIKNGATIGFLVDKEQATAFRVEIYGEDRSLIAQGEFTKVFTKDKPVYLYIRDDKNGNTYITDTHGF